MPRKAQVFYLHSIEHLLVPRLCRCRRRDQNSQMRSHAPILPPSPPTPKTILWIDPVRWMTGITHKEVLTIATVYKASSLTSYQRLEWRIEILVAVYLPIHQTRKVWNHTRLQIVEASLSWCRRVLESTNRGYKIGFFSFNWFSSWKVIPLDSLDVIPRQNKVSDLNADILGSSPALSTFSFCLRGPEFNSAMLGQLPTGCLLFFKAGFLKAVV